MTQLAPLKKLDRTSLVADEVIEQKDGKPPLSASSFVHMDKEEIVNAIFTHSCSVLKENSDSHVVSGSASVSYFGEHTVC